MDIHSDGERESLFEQIRLVLAVPGVWIGALGYFIDLYDLVLFGVVRVDSLRSLGLDAEAIASVGARLLNIQLLGMLVGGLVTGWAADRYGRVRTLFASIFLYSIANLLNAFAWDIPTYSICRFLSGFGLAGEFGIAVTLVSEALPIRLRGLGSTVVGLVGFAGASISILTSHLSPWKVSYAIGGLLGLALLALRLRAHESPIFSRDRETAGPRWSILRSHAGAVIGCVLVGAPVWFVNGLLFYFSPEIARALGVDVPIVAGTSILLGYLGSILGDVAGGIATQALRSRRRTIATYLALGLIYVSFLPIVLRSGSSRSFYGYIFALGFVNGYWALFATFCSERFPTRIRGTMTTLVPNLVRASAIPMVAAYVAFRSVYGDVTALVGIGVVVFVAAGLALALAPETFARDLERV